MVLDPFSKSQWKWNVFAFIFHASWILSAGSLLLGMWVSENEGARFWLAVCTELSSRGMKNCFIARVYGLTGFPEAIETVFPHTQVQLCVVHLVRNSLKYVNYKQRKDVAGDLKAIYSAVTVEDAEEPLDVFAEKWDQQYPAISRAW